MEDMEFADVVVATDGSEPAAAAVETGLSLATALGARLHACTVVDPFAIGQRLPDLRAAREEADERVAAIAERAREAGVDAEPVVREGTPHRELSAYVDDVDANLFVIGTHGRGGARRALLGSVAEKLVRTVEVPVLVVHGNDRPGDDGPNWTDAAEIVLATDGSDAAAPAERTGVALSEALGARLTAVSVVDESGTVANVGGGMLTEETIAAVRRALDERAGDAVERVVERTREAGAEAAGEVIGGEPSRAICGYASDADADLIVVGTHGRGGIRRIVLGSVAERVIRCADRPVLVVPAAAGDLAEDEGDTEAEANEEADTEAEPRAEE
ncbi:universal stress protein [Halobaculum magnesiiphilum]|uniref:Universal stress protein n=1 Tax=Halobaculum magnesiiphilum TaxID=1017351 RepID=A0A8T8WG01_9EURY|nr:universal stress protein [Halobaculum magnesiiphilum]QZP38673.1 universal stress protein [Halobaculum magnesiiphilum]